MYSVFSQWFATAFELLPGPFRRLLLCLIFEAIKWCLQTIRDYLTGPTLYDFTVLEVAVDIIQAIQGQCRLCPDPYVWLYMVITERIAE